MSAVFSGSPVAESTEAVAGVERINADYERHRRAACQLAGRFFSTDRVLGELLDAALD